MIVRVFSVVLRRTAVGVDWRFDNLSGSHHHSDDGFRSGCRNVMSVNTNNSTSPSQDYTTNPDDHSNHNIDSPGFKPFTVINRELFLKLKLGRPRGQVGVAARLEALTRNSEVPSSSPLPASHAGICIAFWIAFLASWIFLKQTFIMIYCVTWHWNAPYGEQSLWFVFIIINKQWRHV